MDVQDTEELYVIFKTRTGVLYQTENAALSGIEREATLECFTSDKARTASVLNGLKNDPSYEFIGEAIFVKSMLSKPRKLDLKLM